MKRILSHVVPPLVAAGLFFGAALTPVRVFGCRGRGLLAISIALASLLAALTCTIVATVKKGRGDKTFVWWVLSSMLFLVPVVGLILLA